MMKLYSSMQVQMCIRDSNDSNGDSDNAAFDPNIPVQVSGIHPTTGGFGPRLVISCLLYTSPRSSFIDIFIEWIYEFLESF